MKVALKNHHSPPITIYSYTIIIPSTLLFISYHCSSKTGCFQNSSLNRTLISHPVCFERTGYRKKFYSTVSSLSTSGEKQFLRNYRTEKRGKNFGGRLEAVDFPSPPFVFTPPYSRLSNRGLPRSTWTISPPRGLECVRWEFVVHPLSPPTLPFHSIV